MNYAIYNFHTKRSIKIQYGIIEELECPDPTFEGRQVLHSSTTIFRNSDSKIGETAIAFLNACVGTDVWEKVCVETRTTIVVEPWPVMKSEKAPKKRIKK